MLDILMYGVLGAVVGFLSGLLGVGGGGILVPMLTSIFTFRGLGEEHTIQMAVATSLACALPTTATSAYAHHQKGAVLWRFVKTMGVGVVLGSLLGIAIATWVNGIYLAVGFTLFMLIAALQLFFNWQPKPHLSVLPPWVSVLMGVVIGTTSVLISVGGAFFSILFLNYNGVDTKKAIGTSSAIGFISFLFATSVYLLFGGKQVEHIPYRLGYVYLPAFLFVTLTSVLFVPIGTNLSHNLPNKKLKQILGVLCVFLSVNMLVSML